MVAPRKTRAQLLEALVVKLEGAIDSVFDDDDFADWREEAEFTLAPNKVDALVGATHAGNTEVENRLIEELSEITDALRYDALLVLAGKLLAVAR